MLRPGGTAGKRYRFGFEDNCSGCTVVSRCPAFGSCQPHAIRGLYCGPGPAPSMVGGPCLPGQDSASVSAVSGGGPLWPRHHDSCSRYSCREGARGSDIADTAAHRGAVQALGGHASPAAVVVWHCLGVGLSLRDWPLREGWSGRGDSAVTGTHTHVLPGCGALTRSCASKKRLMTAEPVVRVIGHLALITTASPW